MKGAMLNPFIRGVVHVVVGIVALRHVVGVGVR